MDREQKAEAVAELTERLKQAEAVFAVDYRGISVTDAKQLRIRLAEAEAVFTVVKNRLAKRAAADAGTAELDELLVGPTALTLIGGDAVIAAKAIADFAKTHPELEYKGGLMDGEALDPDGFQAIARLPGLDVLHGQLVGLAASPLTGLASAMGNMISGLARQLSQIAEQGLVSGEAPAEVETPAAEAAPAAEQAPAEEEAPAEEQAPAEEAPAEAEEAAPEAEEAPAEAEAPAEEPEAEALAAETSNDEEEQGGGEQESPADEAEDNEEEQ